MNINKIKSSTEETEAIVWIYGIDIDGNHIKEKVLVRNGIPAATIGRYVSTGRKEGVDYTELTKEGKP